VKRIVAPLAALAVLAAIAPASGALDAPAAAPGSALVRVAHFSPDTAGVDVWVDSARELQNVSYNTVSDYATLPAGPHQLALRPVGAPATSTPLLSANVTLAAGSAHTVAGVGLNKQLRGQIFDDDLSAPEAGAAKVRIINAAVGIEPIDVTVAGGPPFPGSIGFAAASPYEQVPAGKHDLQVLGSAHQNVLLNVPGVDVGAGIIYSFAVIGGAGKPTQFVPVVDARGPALTPAGAAKTGGGGTARVRVHKVHHRSRHHAQHHKARHRAHKHAKHHR
jgi:hypothetical protein